jgi:hypothetical protein
VRLRAALGAHLKYTDAPSLSRPAEGDPPRPAEAPCATTHAAERDYAAIFAGLLAEAERKGLCNRASISRGAHGSPWAR